ncbi:unnamed protein product [Caenorhabditis bovis]|uniref:Uncharacterized protein n=1 Tax=Caenorhabditis bovis TaxID=2654633 RepID=A0A8S1ED24_9PELO|nr:unnamed protein product [Caenorhabditis bovis]
MHSYFIILQLIPLVVCQNPYGPSQLDLYFKLLRSRNLGGFGLLENAATQLETAEKQQLLSGLPPLPMTHEEVIHVLTTEAPTTTAPPTAKPTTAPPPANPFVVNNQPEFPPIPEERLGGTFDDDGNFIQTNKVTPKTRRNVARGARNYRLSDSTSKNLGYSQQYDPQQSRYIRQHNQPQPTRQTYPPLIFRAKSQPKDRDPYLNNLLLEIEEYDDFLDQVQQYKSRYPGAQVPNPYRSLPEGKLPALSTYKS